LNKTKSVENMRYIVLLLAVYQ